MRIRLTSKLIPLVVLLLAGCVVNDQPVVQSVAPIAPAPRIAIVELRGTPEQLGEEQGLLLNGEIHLLHDKYLMPMIPDAKMRMLAFLGARGFESFISPDHAAEISALSQATGIDHEETVLSQCFLDLSPHLACSTIALPAEASPDGIARFGRNLDFPSFGIADKHSVLVIYHPQNKYAFASITWPGLIGVLSGMNEHGLCLANMEVPRQPRIPSAMPYTLLYRTILERCKTTDEAIALLQNTPRQTANNLMVMDAAGNRAVVEIRPEKITVRRGTPSAALLSTNHQRGAQDMDTAGYCWRYDSLHKAAEEKFKTIDAAAIESMLGDVVQGKNGDLTLQSMIFEPATRVLYLSTGSDAAHKTFDRIDLKNYFK